MSEFDGMDVVFVLKVTGKSARDLYSVGVTDLVEYFLPQDLKIDSNDIAECYFTEGENTKNLRPLYKGDNIYEDPK